MTDFDRILDDAFSRLQAGESIDAILDRYFEYAEALTPLLETAALSLHAYTYAEPASHTGMARGRQRFLSEAARRAEKRRARLRCDRWSTWLRPARRWALAITALLLLFLAVGTTAVLASTDTLPGDLLYPVKIAAEEARLAVTRAPESRARLHMARAERREQELQTLLARQEPLKEELLVVSLNEAEAALRELSRLPAEKRRQPLDTYVEFARTQAQRLKQARAQVPPSQQTLLDAAAIRYRDLANLAQTAQTDPDVLAPVPTGAPLMDLTRTPEHTFPQRRPTPTRQAVPATTVIRPAPVRPTATATHPIRPASPTPLPRPQTPALAATQPATARPAPATLEMQPTRTPTSQPLTRPVPVMPSRTPVRKPTRTPTRGPVQVATAVPTSQPRPPTSTPTVRATPTPGAIALPTTTPSTRPTATETPTSRPTPTPGAIARPTATPSTKPTATETPTSRPTPTPGAIALPTATPSTRPTATPTPTIRPTSTPTARATPTPGPIALPTATPSTRPTATPTPTIRPTSTPTSGAIARPTATLATRPTATKTPATRPTSTPAANEPEPSPTPTHQPEPSPSPTHRQAATAHPTAIQQPTRTLTATLELAP